MKRLKILTILAYTAVITAILTATISHGLAIGLYVIAILIGVFLLIKYNLQSFMYYVACPVIINALVEIINVLFVPGQLNDYFGKLYLLIFSVTVAYLTYRKKHCK